jgi:hypothetical protein
MSMLKAFVSVAVLAAFLAGSVVTNYIYPQSDGLFGNKISPHFRAGLFDVRQ